MAMEQVFHIIPPRQSPYLAVISIITFLLILMIMFVIMSFSMKKVKYIVNDSSLIIKGLFSAKTFALSDLQKDAIRVVNLKTADELQPVYRMNGVGLPGFQSGWYRLKNNHKALLFLSDHAQVVYIPTVKDFVLLLSVDDPSAMVKALQN